jgi:hypothetical protein
MARRIARGGCSFQDGSGGIKQKIKNAECVEAG